MKAIKALVIGMGVLIVVGIGFVIYGISAKFDKRAGTAASAPVAEVPLDAAPKPAPKPAPGQIPPRAVAPVPAASPAPFDLTVAQPAGSRIVASSLSGDRLVLTLEGGGPPRVVVVDVRSGAVLGGVSLSVE